VHNTKANEGIDPHKALARELLANDKIKAYLQNVVAKLEVKAGGEEKFEEAILKAAEVADKQQGGAPGDGDDDDDGHDDDGRPQDETPIDIRNSIIRRIPQSRRTLRGINVVLLVGLILMMFMIEQVDGRRMGRGNTARINTPALDNMLNPYDPSRPGQIWSFWNALFNLFGYGPGAWGPDPGFHGPPRDLTRDYGGM
jgi:hypothetical protein